MSELALIPEGCAAPHPPAGTFSPQEARRREMAATPTPPSPRPSRGEGRGEGQRQGWQA